MYARTSEAHADVPPREPDIMKEVARRVVAKRAIFVRFYFPFRLDEASKSVGPGVQLWKDLFVTRQIFCLIVAVDFVFSKFHVLPQRSGKLHPTIPALPHQLRIKYRARFRTVPAQDRNNVCEDRSGA